jgi:hypothetical protein
VVALTLSTGDALLAVSLTAIPVATLAFALGARGALRQIGRGPFAIDRDPAAGLPGRAGVEPESVREAELRQLLEGKAYRQSRRGERPLDVESELRRLLAADDGGGGAADPELRAEIRSLVIANNERRQRRGLEPLDVEAEVKRRLAELG